MPATQDYTLIQFMRGSGPAAETVVPQPGEPLIDIDSGTLYYGNGQDARGIPINTATAEKVKSPLNLNDRVIWGRYYIEGKVANLPEGIELQGKFFLTVYGSAASESASIWQRLNILTGDFQDQTFVRSSTDSGHSWTPWKGNDGGIEYLDRHGIGTIEKDPMASLEKYVLPSQSFINYISGGPTGVDGCSGFLFVYRKDVSSPYIFQQLIVLGQSGNAGKVFCRLSATGNRDWSAPGYTWRELSHNHASKNEYGTVKVGDNIKVTNGVISVPRATSTVLGVTKLSSNVDSDDETVAATAKAVHQAYEKASSADSKKYVIFSRTLPSTPPADLPDGGLVIVG